MTQNRTVFDIPLFHKVYDLYKLLHSYHEKIPKMQRYTLWKRCENVSLSIIDHLIRTSYLQGTERVGILHEISYNVDLLKVLIRLAKDSHTITPKQYLDVQTALQEVGKMIGGWLKSVAH